MYRQESDEPLPTGDVTLRMEFEADSATPATGSDVRLFADGKEIGKGRMDNSVSVRFSGYAGMDIGRDNGVSSIAATRTRRRSPSREPSRRSCST